MITLHESNTTSFPHDNGIGVLRDVIRAYAEEELNGMFEFYMEYDSEGFLVDELKEERIIKAKAQDKLGYQLFRIYSITKNHENDNLIVRAQHITYDLADNFVEKLEANNLTKKQVMELIGSSTVLPHPFNVTSTNTTTRSSTKLYRTNPLQMIGGIEGSVLQIWGGQIERDNFNLILHDRRGSDDGVKVTYEKNIKGLEATFDISGLVTRIFPFVFIEGSDNEPDRLITVNGKYIDSPHINDYEKIYIKPIDYSNDERIDIQDKTDAQIRQQLTNIANSYFTETGNDKIKVDMEVQFEHLWETEEYKDLAVLELVGMGDTVTIEHSRLKVNATAIVNYIRYDCIAEKNEEVRLGSVKARLTDNVNKTLDVVEKVEQAQQTANQAIRAANGKNTIYYGPDEPEGGIEGDLWFRVVDGEYTRTYRHDGIQWQLVLSVDVRDAIDEAQQAKDDAQQAVDRANQATQQATNAINQAQTAFDEAQQALSTANNALTQATSAFTTANEAFNEVESLSTIVDENTGEISTIKQSVIGLQTRVSDNEGNISNLTQIAQGLQTQVTDIEGNVSTLQQTAQGLQSSVTNLQDELDNLEIGGRNLLRNSDFSSGLNYWQQSGQNTITLDENGYSGNGLRIVSVNDTLIIPRQPYYGSFSAGENLTVSVKVKTHSGDFSKMSARFANSFSIPFNHKKRLNDDWELYVFTGTVPSDYNFSGTVFGFINTLGEFTIDEVKLEKGNKPTDWTPAPEDIDHQFSVITQTIDSITTRIGDAEGNISVLQQTSSSLAARLTDAEGNITSLTATVSGLQTTVTNVQGDVSSVTQLANALQVRMTNAEGDISTLTQTASSLQSTISSVRDDLDNLEIGGRNLLRDSNNFSESVLTPYDGSTITVTENVTVEEWSTDEATRIIANSGNRTSILKVFKNIQNLAKTVEGETYTISLFIKNNRDVSMSVRFNGLEGTPIVSISPREVRRIIVTGKRDSSYFQLQFRARETNFHIDFTVYGAQVEKGNKATDWTPAPEDMATQSQITQLSDAINLRVQKGDVINQINISTESILIDGRKVHITGQTTIDDAVIKSAHIESLDGGKITAGSIDAGKLNVIELSAISGNLGTVTAGRIETLEIAGVNNPAIYFESKSNPKGLIDYNDNAMRFQRDLWTYYRVNEGGSTGSVGVIDSKFLHQFYGAGSVLFSLGLVGSNSAITSKNTMLKFSTSNEEIQVRDAFDSNYANFRANDIRGRYVIARSIYSLYNINRRMLNDFNNGNVSVNAVGGELFLGNEQTTSIRADTTLNMQNFDIVFGNTRLIRDDPNFVIRNNASTSIIYLQANNEIRATAPQATGYIPVRASSFPTGSLAEFKQDIKVWQGSALDIINGATIYDYMLNSDVESGKLKRRYGLVVGEGYNTPSEVIDGDGVEQYLMNSISWKAIQELYSKFTNHEDRINYLELENQYLKQKIKQLEGKVA